MATVGIVCEYNPFHAGHGRQLRAIRELLGRDTAIVCLMSGSFVQRGHPAILDKSLRARAAVESGADLVLEMPVQVSLRSAEGFAAGAVRILSKLCDALCFGTETASREELLATAGGLLAPDFPSALRHFLDQGLSFPAARARALARMGLDASLLEKPNDTLGVEYCKAVLSQGCGMEILPIHRGGGYHDKTPDPENPSATFARSVMESGEDISPYIPATGVCQLTAGIHTLAAGERAVLARLRTMTDEEFEALPYGSEGLWRKLMHEARRQPALEDILSTVKSKRYTRTRLDRMVMCAFLGLTEENLSQDAPYLRVLAMNSRGRSLLRDARQRLDIRNPGEDPGGPYWCFEQRLGDLYGLFAAGSPDAPGAERRRRIFYKEDAL